MTPVPKSLRISLRIFYGILIEQYGALGHISFFTRRFWWINSKTNFPSRTILEFQSISLQNEIIDAVTKSFNQIISNNQSTDLRFAVRSSAIGEDSDDASSAGQNETFLGLRNLTEVLESIKKCWSSLFTYQSVEYRRQHIQPIDAQMSVVVQVMVPSDCAGVLFTRHPASGDPSKIMITANYGLGETVVSGAVDPDTYIVYRKYKVNSFNILEKNIGSKKHYLHMPASGQGIEGISFSSCECVSLNDESIYLNFQGNNVVEQVISQTDQNKSCLSDEHILRLSAIGVFVEKLFGNARDIEWAVHKVRIMCQMLSYFSKRNLNFTGCDIPPSVTSNHNSQFLH